MRSQHETPWTNHSPVSRLWNAFRKPCNCKNIHWCGGVPANVYKGTFNAAISKSKFRPDFCSTAFTTVYDSSVWSLSMTTSEYTRMLRPTFGAKPWTRRWAQFSPWLLYTLATMLATSRIILRTPRSEAAQESPRYHLYIYIYLN